jgi:putative nucleotidyltransferase with HDIG domain
MSRRGRFYVWAVIVVGFACTGEALRGLFNEPPTRQWLVVALLTIISGSATVRLPSLPIRISVSETFLFTAVLLFGPAVGVATVLLDSLVIAVRGAPRPFNKEQVLFNIAAPTLSLWVASNLFYAAAGVPPLVKQAQQSPIGVFILPLLLFTVVYFCLNSGLVAVAVGFEKRLSPFSVWRQHMMWLSLNYFGGASVAALMVVYTRQFDWTYVAVTVPLLLILYMTFRTSLARVADANRHVEEVNALYLATVQTLAAVIDAKDKVTHSHIRRVQRYAVDLATAIGVQDEMQLKAIQAAAVLHDTGKIAVPEAILNKPGPLTADEFAVMKQHATVGADIISAVNFPYPVEPIVRHHHENWDGTGYPAGLVGTEIPIGARILAVVDCFDALTSDRPYRARMEDGDALEIISERRGNMYDPLVVDVFLRIYPAIRTSEQSSTAREDVDASRADGSDQADSDTNHSVADRLPRGRATEAAKY